MVAIISLVAFFVLGGLSWLGSNPAGAEAAGREYTRKLYPTATNITAAATGTDSDGDGYISTMTVATLPDGKSEQLELECAGNRFKIWVDGCRPLVRKLRGQ